MRAVRRGWRRLELGWRTSLRRLPFFTQRTAVLLVGVLVASLAMLGGVVALAGGAGTGRAARGTQPPGGLDHHDHHPPRAPSTRSATSSARSSPPSCPDPIHRARRPGPGLLA